MLIGKKISRDGFRKENKFTKTDRFRGEVEFLECKVRSQTLLTDILFRHVDIKRYLFK